MGISGFFNDISSSFDSIGSGLKKGWNMVGGVIKPIAHHIHKGGKVVGGVLKTMSQHFGFLGSASELVNNVADGADMLARSFDAGDEIVNNLEKRQKQISNTVRQGGNYVDAVGSVTRDGLRSSRN